MGEIIHFPLRSRLRSSEELMITAFPSGSSDYGPETSDAPRRAAVEHLAAELRNIDEAISNVSTFDKAEDAQRAARNLTEMLREARERGVRKAKIARKVWPSDESNPAKRFDKITLPRTGEPNQRLLRLQKRPSNYQRAAEALGELVPGWSREEALVRVFRNTAVGRELERIVLGRASRVSDPDSCWHNLAEMFDALARAVSDQNGLPAHFERISQTPGRYDLAAQAIVPAHVDILSGGDRLLHYGPLANDFALWGHYPPVPSVPLFDNHLAGPFSQTLELTDRRISRYLDHRCAGSGLARDAARGRTCRFDRACRSAVRSAYPRRP